MRTHPWPGPPTLAAGALMAIVTGAFGVFAVASVQSIDPDRRSIDRAESLAGLTALQANNSTALFGIVVLALCLLTTMLTVGVLRRREQSRHAAILVFGVLGVLALGASVPGLFADPPTPNAVYGVLTGGVNLAIVALLLLPATADEFTRTAHERQRQRTAAARGRGRQRTTR